MNNRIVKYFVFMMSKKTEKLEELDGVLLRMFELANSVKPERMLMVQHIILRKMGSRQ